MYTNMRNTAATKKLRAIQGRSWSMVVLVSNTFEDPVCTETNPLDSVRTCATPIPFSCWFKYAITLRESCELDSMTVTLKFSR